MSEANAVRSGDWLRQIKANESRLRTVSYGTYGICIACYTLASITEHHVVPRSVHQKTRDWRPFKAMLCRKCHTIVHQLETNENLYMKHKTLADLVGDIRKRRNDEITYPAGGGDGAQNK